MCTAHAEPELFGETLVVHFPTKKVGLSPIDIREFKGDSTRVSDFDKSETVIIKRIQIELTKDNLRALDILFSLLDVDYSLTIGNSPNLYPLGRANVYIRKKDDFAFGLCVKWLVDNGFIHNRSRDEIDLPLLDYLKMPEGEQ